MTVLEESLRKLVREEAAKAATAVQDEFHQGIRDAILRTTTQAANEAIVRAIDGIARHNQMIRPIMAAQPVAAMPVKLDERHDNHVLVDARYKALQLAIAHKPEAVIPTAAALAQFMLDGVGVPGDKPAETIGAEQA